MEVVMMRRDDLNDAIMDAALRAAEIALRRAPKDRPQQYRKIRRIISFTAPRFCGETSSMYRASRLRMVTHSAGVLAFSARISVSRTAAQAVASRRVRNTLESRTPATATCARHFPPWGTIEAISAPWGKRGEPRLTNRVFWCQSAHTTPSVSLVFTGLYVGVYHGWCPEPESSF